MGWLSGRRKAGLDFTFNLELGIGIIQIHWIVNTVVLLFVPNPNRCQMKKRLALHTIAAMAAPPMLGYLQLDGAVFV